MESIGEKLRSAREEKGYSIDQVARDTNIARRFVEALEREDFSVFPGDPYVIGFLRNYADYLGLDPQKVVVLYKNLQIQEQPIPVEELIQRRRKIPFGIVALVLVVLTLLGAAGYGLFSYLKSSPESEAQVAGKSSSSGESTEPDYVMREEIIEQRFEEGDLFRIHLEEGTADLLVASVDETVVLEYGEEAGELALGKERLLDLNRDGREDIRVTVHDIDIEAATAVLRFDRSLFDASGYSSSREEIESSGLSETAVGSTSAESREQSTTIILSADEAEAFRVSVDFRGYCLVRYLKDGAIREERYFYKGETFRLDVSEELMLWISNAGSFKARVAGEEVSFGGPGEVSTKLIRWEQADNGEGYHLKLIPVY